MDEAGAPTVNKEKKLAWNSTYIMGIWTSDTTKTQVRSPCIPNFAVQAVWNSYNIHSYI
jgi:uncharacterized protein (DUF2147 family)